MTFRSFPRYSSAALLGCLLALVGCGRDQPSDPATTPKPVSTIDEVCKIAAELFGVDRSKVSANTSLADLGADELDLVELVMHIEEQFDVTIPDTIAGDLAGPGDWKLAMRDLTMIKLASIVDEDKRAGRPRTHAARQSNAAVEGGLGAQQDPRRISRT